jgi:diguanylate cyclase (GGDEF)-like protein
MAEDDRSKTVTKDISQFVPKRGDAQPSAYLLVLAGENAGAIYRLENDETVVGRASSCTIVLNDEGISRTHVKVVRLGDGRVLLKDLGSTNGTFVDSAQIRTHVLKDGDRFQLGDVTLLKFSHSDEIEESFQRRLYESSVRDGLTRTFNRRHLDERLRAEFSFSTRHGLPFAVIMFDLDHFKRINDVHGHQAGDEVLRSVGAVLSNAVRAEDVVARYGGEEFVILSRGTAQHQGMVLAERVRAKVQALEIAWAEARVTVSISAGVAAFDCALYPTPDALVAAADAALYEAKRLGRNRVVAAVPPGSEAR